MSYQLKNHLVKGLDLGAVPALSDSLKMTLVRYVKLLHVTVISILPGIRHQSRHSASNMTIHFYDLFYGSWFHKW